MTLIRVNPESVRGYGLQAQQIFEEIHASLVALVDAVVQVRYFGPNAVAFKSECGRVAADFAARLHADMASMADAVRRSTSNIAAALGGEPIAIQLDGRPIQPPIPTAVPYVDVDTTALEALVPVVARHFTALADALTSHLQRLQATDWEGNAKLASVDAVLGFTSSARRQCSTAEETLTSFINGQIETVVTADR
jgi:hypothetical protein